MIFRSPSIAWFVVALSCLPACGSEIAAGGSASTGGKGGDDVSGSASTSSEGSGAGGSGAGGVGGGATTSGGGGSDDPCEDAFMSIGGTSGEPPPVWTLDIACEGSWGSEQTSHALGYSGYTGGGPGSKHETFLEACSSSGPERLAMRVPLFAPGTSKTDAAVFSLSGQQWTTGGGLVVTIRSYGPVNGLIEGEFKGTLTSSSGSADDMAGAFRVCRVSDFLPP
jgi:hypothetical protein